MSADAFSAPPDAATTAPEATRPASAAAIDAEAANKLIQHLFDVGLELAACAGMVQGAAAGRLVRAIAGLDKVIIELRRAVFAQVVAEVDSACSDAAGSRAESPYRPH